MCGGAGAVRLATLSVCEAEHAASEPGTGRPLRVLVVDDVEVNRELLGEMLGRHGHAVSFAANGAEAVAAAAREQLDAVLMDVQMPVMDGVEATRLIRALPPPAGAVPIVGLTADVMERTRQRCLAAGMDDCLGKPFDWPQVFAALKPYAGTSLEDAEPSVEGAGSWRGQRTA